MGDQPADPPPSAAPHYAGHRNRLRERFRRGGSGAVQDYELLELALFNAIPRRDVKPLAKALLAEFRTLADVFAAPRDRLAEISIPVAGKAPLRATDRVADEFLLIRTLALEFSRDNLKDRPVLSSWHQVLDYVRVAAGYEDIEQFRVLFLDNKNHLIRDEKQTTGTVNHTPVYPREVVKRALALNAVSLILVHNHPSGDPTPSKADITVTNDLVAAAKAVGISVHDHLIVGRGQHASFRALGLI